MSECKACHGTGRIEYGEFGFDCAAMHNGGRMPDAPGLERCDDCEGTGQIDDEDGEDGDDECSHLLPYGYAPGQYMGTCRTCGETQIDLDKRAINCRACAERLYAERAMAHEEGAAGDVCPKQGLVATDADGVRRELMALARRDVITDRDRVLIGAAIGLIGRVR